MNGLLFRKGINKVKFKHFDVMFPVREQSSNVNAKLADFCPVTISWDFFILTAKLSSYLSHKFMCHIVVSCPLLLPIRFPS